MTHHHKKKCCKDVYKLSIDVFTWPNEARCSKAPPPSLGPRKLRFFPSLPLKLSTLLVSISVVGAWLETRPEVPVSILIQENNTCAIIRVIFKNN